MKAARKLRKLQQPRSLLDFVRQFLTPQVFKQARQAVPRKRAAPRWDLQPLLMIALAMTWAAGDSQEEKFETARGFYVATHEGRKRPGKTLQGFLRALSRIPMRQLWALATGVRNHIQCRLGEQLLLDGFVPMGCDGSKLECPHTAELEARLKPGGKADSAPMVWVTAFVHLGTGLLWSWYLGPGTADERLHLCRLLNTLPTLALIIADAAYMGYELAWEILRAKRSFLMRLSSKNYLYTMEQAILTEWTEGLVYYWPERAQKKGEPPIPCRLIRIRASRKAKSDVWLLTNVLDPERLTANTADRFYRWRWRNEGIFRTYKRTINKIKLSSRTVRLAHREAEVSLLALQILLAHADLAHRLPTTNVGGAVISPRKVLLAIRKELRTQNEPRTPCYADRLKGCRVIPRHQASAKARREWPARRPHQAPKPPNLRTLNDAQKILLDQHLNAA
jgi:Transposase DDE domain